MHGMVRDGMVWYGTVRYGMVCNSTVGHSIVRYGTVRYGIISCQLLCLAFINRRDMNHMFVILPPFKANFRRKKKRRLDSDSRLALSV